MEVEFTARKVKISRALRTQAEEGMERIARILGKTVSASVTFSAQKLEQIAEVTVKTRLQTIAAEGKADNQASALKMALEHAENQSLRYRERQRERKRLPKEEKVLTAPPVTPRSKTRAIQPEAVAENGTAISKAKARKAIAVHSFPARTTVVEPHVVEGREAIAQKPMTLEEAVKETEFRDRDLLIFRNGAGDMFVLHRRRDGQMELVELP
jgi:putative sigma-54 modulation protein